MELLLETHKPFSLLLSIIKTQCIAQLKVKLYKNTKPLNVQSQKQDSSLTNLHPSDIPNNNSSQNIESDAEPQVVPASADCRIEGSESIVAMCSSCCNPYVLSGWCRLVSNLLQAFPELVGAYVHNYCVVASLTRFVHLSII